MKLSKRQIRRIIREEKRRLISEAMPPGGVPDVVGEKVVDPGGVCFCVIFVIFLNVIFWFF